MVHEHKMHTLRFSTRHHAPVHLRPPTSQTHVETKTLDPKDDVGPPRSPHPDAQFARLRLSASQPVTTHRDSAGEPLTHEHVLWHSYASTLAMAALTAGRHAAEAVAKCVPQSPAEEAHPCCLSRLAARAPYARPVLATSRSAPLHAAQPP